MSAIPVRTATANPTKPKSVAEYVSWQLTLCGKPQVQVAQEVGFDKPNVITMIKQGKTKVPVNKIGSMAKALEVDPVFFLKLCLQEYMPDLMESIIAITGQPPITRNEIEFIEVIRSANANDPKLCDATDKAALKAFVASLSGENH